ncbi:MAG TPA: type 1 glutamine amidotransferase [Azospira sp.]|nr:type 1 glutamine amidotransferase [Azospira sp.]
MRPVAIFRHSPTEGPGYFATFLDAHRVPWELIPIDAGAPVPSAADGYAGLCFMGGPMSVNDPLPWIKPVGALIRDAVAKDIPVLGHCLGAQLIAKALGGQVTRNPVKEIGWGTATIDANAAETARYWFGDLNSEVTVFQWHGETFSIPEGAVRLLGNAYCANQMYALGPHLGMQCHVEMTPEMIATWGTQWTEEANAVAHLPSGQTPAAMLADIESKLPAMRQLADRIYGRWIEGLKT